MVFSYFFTNLFYVNLGKICLNGFLPSNRKSLWFRKSRTALECHCITPILKSTYIFSIFRLTYLETLNEWPWTQYLPFLVKLDIKKYFKTKIWQIILILSFIKFMYKNGQNFHSQILSNWRWFFFQFLWPSQ